MRNDMATFQQKCPTYGVPFFRYTYICIFQNSIYSCGYKSLKYPALLSFIFGYSRYFVILVVKGKEHIMHLNISFPKQ